MPLMLKSLALHGYKTFALKTNFEFSSGVTAIVGPNGSGKSNIADALRWVLGEQSYSLLRGKKTEDMIFSGSENKPRAGMASASIIFDNSSNWLPVDFSEVELARNAYRDGRNDYLLNKQHVRLKDFNELLSQSGLSERTYTILGQGLVDASLALKADERRRLFEEAAGIGLYRSRREEALRRLESTQRNIDRVKDILAELGPRMRSLEKQARRSQEYFQVQNDIRVSLREWYGYHWHHSQKEMNNALDLVRSHEKKLKETRDLHNIVLQDYSSYRDQLQIIRSNLNSWHRESARLHNTREEISRESAVLEERRRALIEKKLETSANLNRFDVEIIALNQRLIESQDELIRTQKEFNDSEIQVQTINEFAVNIQSKTKLLEKESFDITQKINNLKTTKVQLETQQESLDTQVNSAKQKIEQLNEEKIKLEQFNSELNTKLGGISKSREECENKLKETVNQIEKYNLKLQNLEENRKIQLENRSGFISEISGKESQLKILEQAENDLIGYSEGSRFLINAEKQSRIKTGLTALTTFMDVPAEYENAIAAALGEFVDSLVVLTDGQAEEAMNLLQEPQAGRVTILPIDKLLPPERVEIPNDPELLGLATDFVKAKPEWRNVVDYLLGKVVIVSNKSTVRRIINLIEKDYKLVTLSGEVYFANGPIQAGRQIKKATISRSREKREIQLEISRLTRQLDGLNEKIRGFDIEIIQFSEDISLLENDHKHDKSRLEIHFSEESKVKTDIDLAKRNLEWNEKLSIELVAQIDISRETIENNQKIISDIEVNIKSLNEKHNTLKNQLDEVNLNEVNELLVYWNTQFAVSSRALLETKNRNNERVTYIGSINNQVSQEKQKLDEVEGLIISLDENKIEIRENESNLNKEIDELSKLIEPAELKLEEIEKQEDSLQQKETKTRQNLANVEKYNNQLQMDLIRKQEIVESLRRKIEEDFGIVSLEYESNVDGPVPLPLEGMVEELTKFESLSPGLDETIAQQRSILRRMGPINPEAQQEYDSVNERFQFLESQVDDLEKAETDLRQVISELDELTRQEFSKTFSAVAEEFKTIFFRLFGGGSAKLLLTEPGNLTETGIDIEARLPGKREQGLALLSGGERSLTAIALVFALLKVSPTPVCVLDEVDAMLDEANVGRFRDLVRELSIQTQFIIITHNRNTVQAADIIYGVTMGRDSVSQVISLKLDEVSDEYLRGKGD